MGKYQHHFLGVFVNGQDWEDLSKGILQEGQKEFVGEAIPPASPLAVGIPGQRKLKKRFSFFLTCYSICVGFRHLGDKDCLHSTAPLPRLRRLRRRQYLRNSRQASPQDFRSARPQRGIPIPPSTPLTLASAVQIIGSIVFFCC